MCLIILSSKAVSEVVVSVHRSQMTGLHSPEKNKPLLSIHSAVSAGGKCHSYQWRTGGWSNNVRAVWCQRSDGVNVTGE